MHKLLTFLGISELIVSLFFIFADKLTYPGVLAVIAGYAIIPALVLFFYGFVRLNRFWGILSIILGIFALIPQLGWFGLKFALIPAVAVPWICLMFGARSLIFGIFEKDPDKSED